MTYNWIIIQTGMLSKPKHTDQNDEILHHVFINVQRKVLKIHKSYSVVDQKLNITS